MTQQTNQTCFAHVVRSFRVMSVLVLVLCITTLQAQNLGSNLSLTGPGVGSDGTSKASGSYGNVRDGDMNSIWQPNSASNERISIKWNTPVTCNTIIIKEVGDVVGNWEVVNHDNGNVLATGTGLGSEKMIQFSDVTLEKIDLVILSGSAPPVIGEFEVYNATGSGGTQYTLSTSAVGGGSVSGGGTYSDGTVATLTAYPSSGYQFDYWSGDVTGTVNPVDVVMNADKTVTANFSAVSSGSCTYITYQSESGAWSSGAIETEHSGYTGDGYVNTDNNSGEWVEMTVNVPSSGSHDVSVFYANGSSDRPADIAVNGSPALSGLSLPGTGSWTSWSTVDFLVSLSAGSNVIRFTATGSSGLPNMDKIEVCQDGPGATTYNLTTSVVGQGSISPSSGSFAAGDVIFLSATPDAGYQFDGWSGDASGTDNPLSITVNSDLNIQGNFSEVQQTSINLNASAGDGNVLLSWSVTNGPLSSQEILRDTDADPAGSTSLGNVSVSQTNYTDNSASNGVTYYYWVQGSTSNGTVISNAASATPSTGPTVDPSLVGYATLTGGTTGGSGGVSVTCSTGDCILDAIGQKKDGIITDPLTIYVNGTITPSNTSATKIDVKDVRDVSIIGVGTSGEFNGLGIKITRAGNVIIQNLKIHHVNIGDKDAVSIEGPADHIWVDHCELYAEYQGVNKDYYDGLLDAKRDSEYITYSWNYMHDSWKMMLVGSSDSDNHDRKITIHHNWFENVNSRMPLFRFGNGHIFNNYYNGVASTGINSRMGACLKVENNYFENAQNPIVSAYSNQLGAVDESGTIYVNVTWNLSGDVNEPQSCSANIPYSYSSFLHNTADVPSIVMQNAGVGKISGARIGAGTFHPVDFDSNVYPNPATEFLNVEINNFRGDEIVRIINTQGLELKAIHMTEKQTNIDLSELAGGIYILQISTSDQTVNRRFIKQ